MISEIPKTPQQQELSGFFFRSDNDLITGFSGGIILGSRGLRVIPPFDLRGMLAAVVGGLWPVEFPFSIFGLADDTRSKFFFAQIPLLEEAFRHRVADLNGVVLAGREVFIRDFMQADVEMLVHLEQCVHDVLGGVEGGFIEGTVVDLQGVGNPREDLLLRLAQTSLVLIDADVGSVFVEAGADAQLPLGEPSEIADALDAITNGHANDLPCVDENMIA